MEQTTINLIIYVILFVFANLSLLLIFGRATHNLISSISIAMKDGVLTDTEIEDISEKASRLGNIAKKLYLKIVSTLSR